MKQTCLVKIALAELQVEAVFGLFPLFWQAAAMEKIKASTVRPATAPGNLRLAAVGLPALVSLDHSLCYTAIYFFDNCSAELFLNSFLFAIRLASLVSS